MTERTRGILRFWAVLLLVVSSGQAAHGQVTLDPTHYWSWSLATPVPAIDTIKVRDQFTNGDSLLFVTRLERLLNPVHKFHYPAGPETPIRDSTLHLTWYDVRPRYRPHAVATIVDQFNPGGYTALVDSLAFLLAPAGKDTLLPPHEPFIGQGSHYLCYRFLGPDPHALVRLRDQFRIADKVVVLQARFLCAPCQKAHRGVVWPPRDTETHLVVYEVRDPYDIFRFPWIHDQFIFDRFPVHQLLPEWLFVPARKHAIRTSVDDDERTEGSTWGRVKRLYR